VTAVTETALDTASLDRTDAVVFAENLRHSYDRRRFALDGVSFTVHRGEVFGLLGRNGAGKSTLIKAMTTLIQPTSGTLRVLGMDPARDGQKIRRRIGVVQQGESFDFTTVQGNLDVYGMLWGIPRAERAKRRETLLARFGLTEIRKRRAFDISGGQKRRVQVAKEFMHDMEILFLDEPTVGLDVIMRRTLLDSVRAEVRRGLTVVFTTHNLEEADYLCDRVAVIDEGRILILDALPHNQNHKVLKRELKPLLEAAANAGNWRSSVVLGILARDGKGVPSSLGEAYLHFQIAAQQGGPEAQRYLAHDLKVLGAKLDAGVLQELNAKAEATAAQHSLVLLYVDKGSGHRPHLPAISIAQAPSETAAGLLIPAAAN